MQETGHASSPLPLLLVPGLLCDEDSWADVAQRLAPQRRVVVGPCGVPASVDRLEAMAQHLLQAMDAPRFALAGHSMGGRIALEMLRLAPQRIAGLALLDSGTAPRPRGATGDEERAARLALVELARREGLAAVARQWLPPMVHSPVQALPVYGRMLAMVERQSAERFAAQVQALLERPDAEPVLRSARCPVLLVCGQQDRWSPPDRHRAMQAACPGAVLRLIDDCGHMSPMEQPAAVAAALAGWLALCDEPRRAATNDAPSREPSAPDAAKAAEVEHACTQLVLRAAALADAQRPDELAALFTEDARLQRPGGAVLIGRAAIAQAYRERPAHRLTVHLVCGTLFDTLGPLEATATSRVLLWAGDAREPESPQGRPTSGQQLVGRFVDRFVRGPEGWRIAERLACFDLRSPES